MGIVLLASVDASQPLVGWHVKRSCAKMDVLQGASATSHMADVNAQNRFQAMTAQLHRAQ